MCASKKNCDIKLRMQNRQKEVKKVPHSRGGKKRETPTSISAYPSDGFLNMTTLGSRIKYWLKFTGKTSHLHTLVS